MRPAGNSGMAQALEAARREIARLRAEEADSRRLAKMARVLGLRIRDEMTEDGVVTAASEIFENSIESDFAYLHLVIDGWVHPPVGHEHDWRFEGSYERVMPEQSLVHMRKVFREQASFVIQDVRTREGEEIPAWLRQAIRGAGVIGLLVVPFGVGDELLGYVALHRCQEGQSFTAAEIDAVESISADLGRGLHQARLYQREQRLVEELKSLDQAKTDFFTTVSHELRSPLTSIQGYVEMLSDEDFEPLSPQQQHIVRVIDRNAARLNRLIDGISRLAKLEADVLKPEPQPVNLVDLLTGAVESARPSAIARRLDITIQVPDQAVIVSADPAQLDEVFTNLLANAVKYTPEGGHIRASLAIEDGTATVRVRDTGIGIPESEREQMFTRFFRASNARKEDIPGTGLGLAIARSIVVSHGGDISVSSQEGEGSAFTVRLPCTVSGWREKATERT
jgi:two-component system, OmpR family, phosphate regulon sensor histidine kinase PhoR